jgi:xanthine dehydrogenase YagS FAD-binding subunit
VLGAGDIITEIVVRDSPHARRGSYVKVRDRASYAFGLASAAVGLDVSADRSTVTSARIALGNVATTPWRAVEAEASLARGPATRPAFERAAELALGGAVPGRHNRYKIELAKRAVVRALENAMGRP